MQKGGIEDDRNKYENPGKRNDHHGFLNGLILPLSLGTMLWASTRKRIVGEYRHPVRMLAFGIAAFLVATWAGWQSLTGIKAFLK